VERLILRDCWLELRQSLCGCMPVSWGSENGCRRLQCGGFLSVVSTLHVFSAVCEVSSRDGQRRLLVIHV
jgi:hypothetical protein